MSGLIDKTWYQKPENVPERINAGGVVVRVAEGKCLVALARDKGQPDYILPKGGVDAGESLLEGACREIEEEAGFKHLHYIKKLAVCERFNFVKTRWLITHYFLFFTDEIDVMPSESERHAKPHWFLLDDLPSLFWPEQRDLLETHHEDIRAAALNISKA